MTRRGLSIPRRSGLGALALLGLSAFSACSKPAPPPAGEHPAVSEYFAQAGFRLTAGGPPRWRAERIAAGQDELVLLEHAPVPVDGKLPERPSCTIVTREPGGGDVAAMSGRLLRLAPFDVTRKAPAEDAALLGLRGVTGLALEGRLLSEGRGGPVESRVLALHARLPRAEVAVVCSASAAAYASVAGDFRALLRSLVTL